MAGVSKEDSTIVSAVEVDGDDPDDSHSRQKVGDGHEGGAGLDQPRHPWVHHGPVISGSSWQCGRSRRRRRLRPGHAVGAGTDKERKGDDRDGGQQENQQDVQQAAVEPAPAGVVYPPLEHRTSRNQARRVVQLKNKNAIL